MVHDLQDQTVVSRLARLAVSESAGAVSARYGCGGCRILDQLVLQAR